MYASSAREVLLERRQTRLNRETLWNDLTQEQKFSVNHLNQDGYELAFIRRSQAGNLAILLQDEHILTISTYGKINTDSSLSIR